MKPKHVDTLEKYLVQMNYLSNCNAKNIEELNKETLNV